MPKKSRKNNAMRLLEARRVPYVAHAFSADIHSAEGVASTLGLPARQVFKTLVVLGERDAPLLAVLPGDATLDLKALARAAGIKRLRMATRQEAERLTGLQVGGISALALLHRAWPVWIDASAASHARILVSAGQRGLNLELSPEDLARVAGARLAPIAAAHPAPAGSAREHG